VWNFVNRFVSFNRFTLNTIANYKGKLYNLPFNMYTFYQMWGVTQPEEARRIIESQRREAVMENPANLEEQAICLVGRDVYATLIKGYTEKQWGRACTELPASIIKRLPVRFTFDNNYFNDRYQGIPVGGYNVLIKGLLDGIEWRTGCNYLDDRAYFDGLADEIVYTGPIDEYFGWSLGFLEYRSLRFEQEMLPVSNYQGNAIVNYTERTVPYTRIVEHKHFEPGNGAVLSLPYTVVTREYPADYTPGSEAYYPVDNKRNRDLHAAYQDMGRCNVPHTWFAGRLGSYKYVDMGQAISSALKLSKALL
jgi:UDP-galactopyranose mutase